MNYISAGTIQLNCNFKIAFDNKLSIELNQVYKHLEEIYQKFNVSRINSSKPDAEVDLFNRKSKSENFSCLINLNFLLDDLKKKCKPGLFSDDWSYDIVPHQFLIYGIGDFFNKHTDHIDENLPHNGEHVATFLIFLNTHYTGGNLVLYPEKYKCVNVDNKIVISDFGNAYKFLLFSLDVPHEVLKIESGYRVCLKFKIYKYKNVIQINENEKYLQFVQEEPKLEFPSNSNNIVSPPTNVFNQFKFTSTPQHGYETSININLFKRPTSNGFIPNWANPQPPLGNIQPISNQTSPRIQPFSTDLVPISNDLVPLSNDRGYKQPQLFD